MEIFYQDAPDVFQFFLIEIFMIEEFLINIFDSKKKEQLPCHVSRSKNGHKMHKILADPNICCILGKGRGYVRKP